MSVVEFQPQLLGDIHKLRSALFSGDRELKALDVLPKSVYMRPAGSYYFNRWDVARTIATLPFYVISQIFFQSTALILYYAYATSLSKRVSHRANCWGSHTEMVLNQIFFGKRILSPTTNALQPQLRQLYYLPVVKKEEIQDKTIQKNLHKALSGFDFNGMGLGHCHGSVYWFNYLVLLADRKRSNLLESCETFDSFLRAIAHLFVTGQPLQAGILQKLYGVEKEILGIEESYLTIEHKDYKVKKNLLKGLKEVPRGIYHVKFPEHHSISYFHFGKEKFVWDPNVGLEKIDNFEELASIIGEYSPMIGKYPIFFARQTLKKRSILNVLLGRH